MFLQWFPLLIFIFSVVLCYNNTAQHIQHSTFNHSEAWDNLERKWNINFYFRAKEIKTQESELPMMNYRHLEPTQLFQLQQCPVYRIISMLEGFLKVYNHNLKCCFVFFFLTAPFKPRKNKDPLIYLTIEPELCHSSGTMWWWSSFGKSCPGQ